MTWIFEHVTLPTHRKKNTKKQILYIYIYLWKIPEATKNDNRLKKYPLHKLASGSLLWFQVPIGPIGELIHWIWFRFASIYHLQVPRVVTNHLLSTTGRARLKGTPNGSCSWSSWNHLQNGGSESWHVQQKTSSMSKKNTSGI